MTRNLHQLAPAYKRRAGWAGLFVATLLPLASCTSANSVGLKAGEAEKLRVVTTFLPITDFTLAVAGDRAEVTQLLPPGVGPHDYQAKPQDVQSLAEADVLVENGLGLEDFLTGLIDNANNPDMVVVDSSEGIATLPAADDGHSDADAHEGSEHQHSEFDPHIWLDPKKAIQQVGNIRDALVAVDPAGEAIYAANADAYIQQLQQLDKEISVALAPYAGQTFVSHHDFAEHFARSYGIDVEYLVDVPEESATPSDMQRVIQAVEGSDLKTLLQEPAQPGSSLSALAKEMNAQVSEFNPMESSGPEGLSPDYYIATMEQNSENLEAAFAQSDR